MKALAVVFTVLTFLSACATNGGTIAPPDASKSERSVNIDERLLQECRPMSDIAANPRPSDVLEQHGKDVLVFKECAESKAKLIEVVRKAFQSQK